MGAVIDNSIHHNIHIHGIILETEPLMFLLICGMPSSIKHAVRPLINSHVLELARTGFYELIITFSGILQSD